MLMAALGTAYHVCAAVTKFLVMPHPAHAAPPDLLQEVLQEEPPAPWYEPAPVFSKPTGALFHMKLPQKPSFPNGLPPAPTAKRPRCTEEDEANAHVQDPLTSVEPASKVARKSARFDGAQSRATAPRSRQAATRTGASRKSRVPNKYSFNVGRAYRPDAILGSGAYGLVASGVHRASTRRVAIKRLAPFDSRFHSVRALREIKILRHFEEQHVCLNIVRLLDLPRPADYSAFKEVYLVQELMFLDLHTVIRKYPLNKDKSEWAWWLFEGTVVV